MDRRPHQGLCRYRWRSRLVPDNTKVAVIKACLYEPHVNRSYAEMAAHYDTAILPARPRRPRDKAKVEAAVLIIERWLLGRRRHHRFYSLAELKAAIVELLRELNDERLLRWLGVTRRALLEQLDRPHLKRLPAEPYCFAEWRVRRVIALATVSALLVSSAAHHLPMAVGTVVGTIVVVVGTRIRRWSRRRTWPTRAAIATAPYYSYPYSYSYPYPYGSSYPYGYAPAPAYGYGYAPY